MKLHELKLAEGSRRIRNRVGRGASSGNSKTNARGRKGQKARSDGSIRPGFEGGQLLLFRRLLKQGSININRKECVIVSLNRLNRLEDGTGVTPALLAETGVVKNEKSGIKVLGNGSLDKELIAKAHKFPASAVETIDVRGGVHGVI